MNTSTPTSAYTQLLGNRNGFVRGDLALREVLRNKFQDKEKVGELCRFAREVRQLLFKEIPKDQFRLAFYYPLYRVVGVRGGFELHVLAPEKTAILFIKQAGELDKNISTYPLPE